MAPVSTLKPAFERLAVDFRSLPRARSPALSIVIVNYRQWGNTARLVRQLLGSPAIRSGAAEIIVVDNDSPSHPIRKKLRRTHGVSLRCLRQNRGFGRGANEGCRLSRGSWFLLLNPDVSVSDEFVERALEYLQNNSDESKLGIVGIQLRDSGGARQASVGVNPTLLGTLLGLLRPRERRKCRDFAVQSAAKVAWVTGCGMLIRCDCFQQLGGFDPNYFVYYEDADLCRRARASGWTVRHEPGLHAIHHRPLHSRRVPAWIRLLTRHALLTFARKHWPAWQTLVVALLVWMEAIWLGRRKHRKQIRLAIDFVRGRDRVAYRRVRRAAQIEYRSREGIRVEAPGDCPRSTHGRRPLPR
jgi:N-acetylglucosaminyl-diphospho-decaprenol L-rhamnosyltransferase